MLKEHCISSTNNNIPPRCSHNNINLRILSIVWNFHYLPQYCLLEYYSTNRIIFQCCNLKYSMEEIIHQNILLSKISYIKLNAIYSLVCSVYSQFYKCQHFSLRRSFCTCFIQLNSGMWNPTDNLLIRFLSMIQNILGCWDNF